MTDDATFLHGQRELRAHAEDERKAKALRFADNSWQPSRKQALIEKRNSVGLLPGEYAELAKIELAERFAADAASERAGEGRLLPVGRTNMHD